MNEMFSPKEVAKILKVNYHKVLDMIHLGKIEAYQIDGQFRISEREIYRYLDSVKVNSFWKENS